MSPLVLTFCIISILFAIAAAVAAYEAYQKYKEKKRSLENNLQEEPISWDPPENKAPIMRPRGLQAGRAEHASSAESAPQVVPIPDMNVLDELFVGIPDVPIVEEKPAEPVAASAPVHSEPVQVERNDGVTQAPHYDHSPSSSHESSNDSHSSSSSSDSSSSYDSGSSSSDSGSSCSSD